jgi:predicted branched-subunit amino acid permease
VPASWALDFTLPLVFIALLIPMLRERPGLAAAITAGLAATIGFRWSYGLNLLIPALSGLAAALLVAAAWPQDSEAAANREAT